MYRPYKAWLGYLLAAALLLSALLPFAASYPHAKTAIPPAQMASIFGEKLLICTGDGFALVSWKDLAAGRAPVKPHPSAQCPLCYLASQSASALLLVAYAALLLPHGIRRKHLLPPYEGPPVQCVTGHPCRPRAPPFPSCID